MSDLTELTLNGKDYEEAFSEVSFLLDVLSKTIGQVVGSAVTSMSVSSGRHMAKKLPVHLSYPPKMEHVMEALAGRLKAGFDIEYRCGEDSVDMKVGRCAVREVCKSRGLEVGGELCDMLHNFWAGMIAELKGLPVRTRETKAGTTCAVKFG